MRRIEISTIRAHVKPERVWIRFNNIDRKGYLSVILEVNGIDKVMREFYIPGLDSAEGICCESHNLSWLFREAPSPDSAKEIERVGLLSKGWPETLKHLAQITSERDLLLQQRKDLLEEVEQWRENANKR